MMCCFIFVQYMLQKKLLLLKSDSIIIAFMIDL